MSSAAVPRNDIALLLRDPCPFAVGTATPVASEEPTNSSTIDSRRFQADICLHLPAIASLRVDVVAPGTEVVDPDLGVAPPVVDLATGSNKASRLENEVANIREISAAAAFMENESADLFSTRASPVTDIATAEPVFSVHQGLGAQGFKRLVEVANPSLAKAWS